MEYANRSSRRRHCAISLTALLEREGVKPNMWTELNNFVLSLCTRAMIQSKDIVKREEGQALVEYTLILALISVVSIVVLKTIGLDVKEKLEAVATAL
jgi:Flp pilus assembly pilin Flp